MKKLSLFIALLIFAVQFTGCLTVEKKEYHISINKDLSGSGKIIFRNILHQKYGEDDSPQKDFEELISTYIDGDKLESDYSGLKIVKKELFEENGQLCGVFEFQFFNIQDVKLFRYNDQAPFMYYINTFDESYSSSNGYFDESKMPVVFWENNTKDLKLITSVAGEVSDEDTTYVSLLDEFKNYKKLGRMKNSK